MPTQTYTPIASQMLASATTTVTFSSIPSTYTDLVLILNGLYTVDNYINMKFNNDSTSTYSNTYLRGDGTNPGSGRASNASYGIGFTSGNPENAIFHIMNYSNTTTNKTVIIRTNKASSETRATVGLWRSTTAINRLDIIHDSTNGFASGSTFTLYGIKAGS